MANVPGFDESRVRVVPYGISGVFTRPAIPQPGRILFVGSELAQKGLPYLAQAASVLRELHPDIEVRIAGESFSRHANSA
jgi:glycosyltransferase involved in cell wall biosynthesis